MPLTASFWLQLAGEFLSDHDSGQSRAQFPRDYGSEPTVQ